MRSNRFALFTQSSLGAIHAYSFHSNALLYRRCRRLFSCYLFKCPGHTQRASCCHRLQAGNFLLLLWLVCRRGLGLLLLLLTHFFTDGVAVFFFSNSSIQLMSSCVTRSLLQPDRSSLLFHRNDPRSLRSNDPIDCLLLSLLTRFHPHVNSFPSACSQFLL